jgi:hypothetical protein
VGEAIKRNVKQQREVSLSNEKDEEATERYEKTSKEMREVTKRGGRIKH